MSKFHPLLNPTWTAGGAIDPYTAVKLSSDSAAVEAADPGDYVVGINGALAVASGESFSPTVVGIAEWKAGGTITRGQLLTCDSNGDAVATDGFTLVQTVIAGGAAGAHTVTGIAATDELVSVIQLDRDATAANITIAALTAEFSISGANTIDNTSGTNTTGDALLVTYKRPITIVGRALKSGVDNDVIPVLLGR